MKKPFFLSLCLVGLIQPLLAYEQHLIDEKTPLALTFSHTSHNRIAVEEGAITKAFGDSSLFSINLDKATGQAFVTLTQSIERPTTLTVITTSGAVQDLSIQSTDCPGEYLLLSESKEHSSDNYDQSINFQAMAVDFLNTILEGGVPMGYGKADNCPSDTLNLPTPLKSETIRTLEGPFEKVILQKITNQGQVPISVKASALKTVKTTWVFLAEQTIGPGAYVHCVVAAAKDEGQS